MKIVAFVYMAVLSDLNRVAKLMLSFIVVFSRVGSEEHRSLGEKIKL